MTVTPTLIEFEVRGIPKPQPRGKARIVSPRGRASFVHIYTPHGGKEWRTAFERTASLRAPPLPFQGPVRVELAFYLPRLKKHAGCGPEPFLASDRIGGDFDNLAKAVVDVLQNCRYFNDDAQVAAADVRKWYAAIGAAPGVRVRVGPVDPRGDGSFVQARRPQR